MTQKEITGLDTVPKTTSACLRLYIAQATPNSIRAEHNLNTALNGMADAGKDMEVEIVNVFTHPKRAITDGVIVTPTLIGIKSGRRLTMMGDLSDSAKLGLFLESLTESKTRSG